MVVKWHVFPAGDDMEMDVKHGLADRGASFELTDAAPFFGHQAKTASGPGH